MNVCISWRSFVICLYKNCVDILSWDFQSTPDHTNGSCGMSGSFLFVRFVLCWAYCFCRNFVQVLYVVKAKLYKQGHDCVSTFNLCASNFQDNLALFWFTSSLSLFLHLRQLSQNAGDFNAKQRESVKKPSDQGEEGGRLYLCSRGRGWERGASRQQRARRGSVWTRVLPARRPASHWRQPQLILGAPRQPSSCPATCSWVWIARLLLQTPPFPPSATCSIWSLRRMITAFTPSPCSWPPPPSWSLSRRTECQAPVSHQSRVCILHNKGVVCNMQRHFFDRDWK